MTLLMVAGVILLALAGAPIFSVIGICAILAFHQEGIDLSAIFIELYRLTSTPALVAIPLFTFAGFILAESKTPERLTRLSEALFGGFAGGSCLIVLASCAFFTPFTGASGVTIIALGRLLYLHLLKENYPKNFGLGLVTSSGSLGLLFPPSLPLILYAVISQANIDKIFLAGIVPGLVEIGIIAIYCIFKSIEFKSPRIPFDAAKAKAAIRESFWEILLPFIILFGIYGGIFTVAEAAAITVVYVITVEAVIYKDIDISKDLPRLMRNSMILVGTILIILGAARGLTNYLIDEQVPMQLFTFIKKYIDNQFTFLIVLNLFLLAVGCTMDIFSAIIVVVPLIIPIAKSFGVDMVHLGIIFLANLEIGYSMPPMGLNLFIASSRLEEPIVKLYIATLPFLALRVINVLLITYVPALCLYPVHLLSR